MVCGMTVPQQPVDRGSSATAIRLRVPVFESRVRDMGAETRVDQARLCGTDRRNLYRIINGETTPTLELAMQMSSRLGLAVEELFEQVG